ncbi:MAG: hypothetical protein CSA22_05615 [Deltaproteobacteria bacterium]|nr:MAG: hypothetical protein CSA22_05615 [Deltaproteobacteria bacterium]
MQQQDVKKGFQTQGWRKRMNRICLIIAVLYALYLAIGYWGVSFLVARQLPRQYDRFMNGTLTLEGAVFNPLELSLTLKGLAIDAPDETGLFSLDRLYVNLQVSSLFRMAVCFREVLVDRPELFVALSKDGRLNLSDLVPAASPQSETSEKPQKKTGEKQLFPLYIGEFRIADARIRFTDYQRDPVYSVEVVPLTLDVHAFHTRSETDSPYALSARLKEQDLQVDLKGGISVSQLASAGQVRVERLPLRNVWTYVADRVGFELFSGKLELAGAYSFSMRPTGPEINLSGGRIRLDDLSMGKKGETKNPLIQIPRFEVSGIDANTACQTVVVSSIRTEHGDIRPMLEADGTLNLATLFADPEKTADPAGERVPPASEQAQTETSPWHFQIKTFDITDYAVRFTDASESPAATVPLTQLRASITDISLEDNAQMPLTLETQIHEAGHIGVQGTVSFQPVSAELSFSVDSLPLSGFQAYLDRYTRIQLDSGELHLTGNALLPPDGNGLQLTGDLGIRTLSLLRQGDEKAPFLAWDALNMNALSLNMDERRFHVQEIRLKEPLVHLKRLADGGINLAMLARETDEAQADASAAEEASESPDTGKSFQVGIDGVHLDNAAFRFWDAAIQPSVNWGMHNLTGDIRGLSSEAWTRADVNISGIAGEYAPVAISGTLNPLSEDVFTDIRMTLEGMELQLFSPYMERYVGRVLEKGKIVFRIRYQVSEQVLEAENRVILDQFSLGKTVNSPVATKLPVKLAVGLLKDKNGVIDVDIPVRGNLKDPSFRYGKAVFNALFELIEKAALYPFKTLGSLVGLGGDALSNVGFRPGDTAFVPQEIDELAKLSEALNNRPNLRLEITGTAHRSADASALAERALNEKLAAVSSPDVDPDQALSTVYADVFGTPPDPQLLTAAGTDIPAEPEALKQALSAAAREKLRAYLAPAELDLRFLAKARADAIKAHLVQVDGMDESRIFLMEVALDADGGDPVPSRLSLTAK